MFHFVALSRTSRDPDPDPVLGSHLRGGLLAPPRFLRGDVGGPHSPPDPLFPRSKVRGHLLQSKQARVELCERGRGRAYGWGVGRAADWTGCTRTPLLLVSGAFTPSHLEHFPLLQAAASPWKKVRWAA